MGLYHLPAGSKDNQDPHTEDEIYHVVRGSAMLTIDGVDHEVAPGASFFVKAQVSHRFHSISADLDVLVVFHQAASDDSGPAARAFSMSEVVASRDPLANTWNPFLVVPGMSLGIYMLPESLGGDSTLIHEFDEINIVVQGHSRFTMGSDTVDLAPGSIVFVERAVGHKFTELSGDLDVLILWER